MSILKVRDNNGNVSEILTIRGPKGETGTPGAGIESVVQTEASLESGGNNIITVTKTDGTTSSFTVKNGEKGEPGTDATVTYESVKTALGYTPADQMDIEGLSDAIDVLNSHDWFTAGVSIPTNGDLNDYTTPGKYYVGSTAIAATIQNSPVTGTNYKMYVIVRTTDKSISQIIFALNNRIYIRSATASGALGGWKTFATTDDIEALSIKSITESTEDGGENVITFNDNKTLTVRNGKRGSSVLKVTTSPASYTTEVGGFTPQYRISLSTVLSQSKATEVRVGDTILRNYYTYLVGYVDDAYAYLGARASIRGSAGTTPVRGTDYWTEADKAEIKAYVDEAILGGSW
jgi:hypothetical protein